MPSPDAQVAQIDRVAPTVLRNLFNDDELAALRLQGAVASRLRGRHGRIFEVRFRRSNQQRRRYLGVDAVQAETVRVALAQWQRGRTLQRQLRQASEEAGRLLRRAKERLRLPLALHGYRFHGRTIREARGGIVEKC